MSLPSEQVILHAYQQWMLERSPVWPNEADPEADEKVRTELCVRFEVTRERLDEILPAEPEP
jgi:hypothetical protein